MRRCAQGSGWCRVRAGGAGVGLLVQRVGVAFAWDLHDRQADETAVQGPTRTLLGRAWRSCESHTKAAHTFYCSSQSTGGSDDDRDGNPHAHYSIPTATPYL